MKELNATEIMAVNGGEYGFCEVVRDGTVGFFTAAGTLVGGATTFGAGAVYGGFIGHMLGNAAGAIVYQDCK